MCHVSSLLTPKKQPAASPIPPLPIFLLLLFSIAFKLQLLFSAKGCIWKYNSDLDDDDKECSIFNGEDLLMLRFSNTKLSMLYKLVSVGKADWIVFNDS